MKLIPSVKDAIIFSLNDKNTVRGLIYQMAHAPLRSSIMADEKREVKLVDLSQDREASAARLEEVKAGRHVDDIPLTDDYWKALKKHRQSFS